ncbi:MAG: glutathione S-transferase family protein [Gammaproteobacteria bacterium]|nr:glutathione S-transferase family protein [Gammaproteobacteria bacterium]
MIILYNFPLSLNCYKVRLLLGLLGVAYQRQPVDLLNGEHKTLEFLAVNPFGQVPALKEGSLILRDSQAILVWLARKYGNDAWMPRDPDQEAVVNAWLYTAAYEVRLGPYDARLAKLLPSLCVNFHTVREQSAHALKLYNDRLTNRAWIALDHPTVADIAAFPAISQSGDGDISLEPYTAVRAWLDRVRALPGFVDLLD